VARTKNTTSREGKHNQKWRGLKIPSCVYTMHTVSSEIYISLAN
jgi:hypothetical protein